MIDSAQDVTEVAPAFSRRIEIRLAEPQPRIRYETNKPVREPVPDMHKVIEALRDEVTQNLQLAYGPETEVVITTARAQDVCLTGAFQQKVNDVKMMVGEVLADAFENLEVPEE